MPIPDVKRMQDEIPSPGLGFWDLPVQLTAMRTTKSTEWPMHLAARPLCGAPDRCRDTDPRLRLSCRLVGCVGFQLHLCSFPSFPYSRHLAIWQHPWRFLPASTGCSTPTPTSEFATKRGNLKFRHQKIEQSTCSLFCTTSRTLCSKMAPSNRQAGKPSGAVDIWMCSSAVETADPGWSQAVHHGIAWTILSDLNRQPIFSHVPSSSQRETVSPANGKRFSIGKSCEKQRHRRLFLQ